ncbi:hypothetical protein GGH94_001985 [Coemansia aciculifera]|uniref:TFIIB-type domain-containing protein n=1 Tax=Coemansia aciculifera TaxID=417176 RepID=A0A9W8IT66_9FUNG|nr:hypothetical protein GGH94_001985 [Coemansia aciculifera]
MAKRGIAVALSVEPSTSFKRPCTRTENSNPLCPECASTEIHSGEGEEYCGDCGAVVNSIILTTNHSYDSERHFGGNYIRFLPYKDGSDPATERFRKRWSQDMVKLAHRSIGNVCSMLGLSGLAERAERIFVDCTKRLMDPSLKVKAGVFGRNGEVRAAASVYIAALEASKALSLVDVAATTRLSVYSIGNVAKSVLSLLNMQLPLADPLLRIERAVNRVFGCALKSRVDAEERQSTVSHIAGTAKAAQGFPDLLLGFLADNEALRPKLIEVAGQVLAFEQLCSRHAGFNPGTLVCSAVAMGIEHLFVVAPDTEAGSLRRCQQEIICRLVALLSGSGQRTIVRHVATLQQELVKASKATPWLAQAKISTDTVAVYLIEILFCYEKTRAWLFALRPEVPAVASEAATRQLVADLDSSPSFTRAQISRERRRAILAAESDSTTGELTNTEAVVIKRLHHLGVDHNALLTLPLHTLEDIAPAIERSLVMQDEHRLRLDLPNVGPEDMPDEEVSEYLRLCTSLPLGDLPPGSR